MIRYKFYMHTPHCTRTYSYSRQHAAHITIWKHGVKNKTINTYYYTHFYFWTIRFTVPWFLWLFLSVFSISYFLVCFLDTEDSQEIVQQNRIGLLSVARARVRIFSLFKFNEQIIRSYSNIAHLRRPPRAYISAMKKHSFFLSQPWSVVEAFGHTNFRKQRKKQFLKKLTSAVAATKNNVFSLN